MGIPKKEKCDNSHWTSRTSASGELPWLGRERGKGYRRMVMEGNVLILVSASCTSLPCVTHQRFQKASHWVEFPAQYCVERSSHRSLRDTMMCPDVRSLSYLDHINWSIFLCQQLWAPWIFLAKALSSIQDFRDHTKVFIAISKEIQSSIPPQIKGKGRV